MRASPRFFYGWVIVAICFVCMGLGYSVWYSFSVFFLAVIEEFGWSRANTALAFSVFVTIHGLTGPLIGMLVERFNLRLLMPLGAILTGATLAACSLVNSPWQYYLIFGVLTSIALNIVGLIPNYAVLNRWFVKWRGLALGICSAGVGLLAILILVPVNQYLISAIGWRATYVVLGTGIAVVLAPLTYLLVRDRPQDLGLLPDGERIEGAGQQSGGGAGSKTTSATSSLQTTADWTPRRAMGTARFWVLGAAYFLWPIAIQMVFVHQAAYVVDLGYDKFLAASVVGMIGLVSIPAKILGGHLSDRFGRQVTYGLGAGGVLSSLCLLLLIPGLRSEWLLYVFALLFGLGYGTNTPLSPAIAGDLYAGKHFAVIYGFLGMTVQLGSAVGPWLAGYLFDVDGSYTPAFLIAIAGTVVSASLIWLVVPRRIRPVADQAAQVSERSQVLS